MQRLREIHDIIMDKAVKSAETANIRVATSVFGGDSVMSFNVFKIVKRQRDNERQALALRQFDTMAMPRFSSVEFEGVRPVNKILCRETTDPLVMEALDIIMEMKGVDEALLMKAWCVNWLSNLNFFLGRIDNIKANSYLRDNNYASGDVPTVCGVNIHRGN